MSCGLLSFSDTFADSCWANPTMVVHILCLDGTLSFTMDQTRYNVSAGDYVLFTPGAYITGISHSADNRLIIMSFHESVTSKCAIKSDYGALGHLALLQNPVMRLDKDSFAKCFADLTRLRERNSETGHYFYEELITSLLKAHIVDLYDIHAKAGSGIALKSRPSVIMTRFIRMLINGDYRTERRLDYYSSALCVTTHYLSEVSNLVSGRPATYWIDVFLAKEIAQLLMQKNISLTEIAYRLNFASVSYLSRYVSKHLGMTPSDFRRSTNL